MGRAIDVDVDQIGAAGVHEQDFQGADGELNAEGLHRGTVDDTGDQPLVTKPAYLLALQVARLRLNCKLCHGVLLIPPHAACPATQEKRATGGRRISAKAGNGTRTRDTLLGKQVLYQLSYTRDHRGV